MTEIIVTTPEQLQTTIEAAVSKAFEAYTKKPTAPENIENDYLTIEEAAAFLNDNGCKITVQTIYTKKLQGKIPCSKIGPGLFSRKRPFSVDRAANGISYQDTIRKCVRPRKSAKNQG